LALECTLIYLGYVKYDWKTAQKALADMKFLEKLKTYERDSVPDKVLQKVKTLTKSPEFNTEKMQKASKAAGGLAKWCKAIREYAESLIIVKPLQEQ
jgi:dynein heavy chain, axonemal